MDADGAAVELHSPEVPRRELQRRRAEEKGAFKKQVVGFRPSAALYRQRMTDLRTVLAEYVTKGLEPAFREVVEGYINLVHATALRLVDGDTPRAEDLVQMVFSDLPRLARTLNSTVTSTTTERVGPERGSAGRRRRGTHPVCPRADRFLPKCGRTSGWSRECDTTPLRPGL